MNTGPTIRCFIAIEPDDAARADLVDAARLIDAPNMRRTPADNLHLTVKFLGDVLPAEIDLLVPLLAEALKDAATCDLTSVGFLAIPNERRPRVVALGFDRPDEVGSLYELVEMAAEDAGMPREGRAFRPHVTLGRFNTRRRPPRDFELPAKQPAPIQLPVHELVIKQSILEPAGATYADLARFPLPLTT